MTDNPPKPTVPSAVPVATAPVATVPVATAPVATAPVVTVPVASAPVVTAPHDVLLDPDDWQDGRPAQEWAPSGGVAEYLADPAAQGRGDLGPVLVAAVADHLRSSGLDAYLAPADQRIRATVLGASQCSTQVSGSTVRIGDEEADAANRSVLTLDTVDMGDLDHLDIGRPTPPTRVVPVAAKSPLFDTAGRTPAQMQLARHDPTRTGLSPRGPQGPQGGAVR